MKANQEASDDDRLTDDQLLGQMSYVHSPPSRVYKGPVRTKGLMLLHRSILFAAMDTTSNALTATMDTLGRRKDVQEKLRAEILEAQDRNGGDIPYDELVALPYLDSVCREILRLYVKSSESMYTHI